MTTRDRLLGGLTWAAGGAAAASCLVPLLLGAGALGAWAAPAEGAAFALLALAGSAWLGLRARRRRPRAGAGEDEPAAPVACDLGALEEAERREHVALAQALFADVAAVTETPRGYAFRVPGGADALQRAARFVAGERRCCPFLRFAVIAEPAGGPVWLELGGPAPVRRYVRDRVVARWERERSAPRSHASEAARGRALAC